MSNEEERKKVKEGLINIIKIKAMAQGKTPLEVIREMKYEMEERKKLADRTSEPKKETQEHEES